MQLFSFPILAVTLQEEGIFQSANALSLKATINKDN